MDDRGSTTLRRGIAVLLELGSDEAVRAGGMGVVQLARNLGEDKGQVSRTLRTLAGFGLAERVPGTQAYRLGVRIYQLAARVFDPRLMQEGPPLLGRLVLDIGERAHLSVLRGREVLTVWTESPPRTEVQATDWAGRTVPAWCTSSGRALLIDHAPAMIDALFGEDGLRGGGPNAPRSTGDLTARVAAAARRGYAVVDEEFEPELVGVAAPIRDYRGRIVAAVNISGPKYRLGRRLDEVGARLRADAAELSELLGAPAAVGGMAGPDGTVPGPQHGTHAAPATGPGPQHGTGAGGAGPGPPRRAGKAAGQ